MRSPAKITIPTPGVPGEPKEEQKEKPKNGGGTDDDGIKRIVVTSFF